MITEVFRDLGDDTEILISFHWDTRAKAQKYFDSATSAKTVQTAGVVSGNIWYCRGRG